MKRVLLDLWTDDCGALLATEWVVLATLIVIGIIPGLVAIRNGVLRELKDVSNATTALDQSYEFTGNELLSPEDEPARVGRSSRRTTGEGSLTEIVTSANGAGWTIVRKTTGSAGRAATLDERDPFSRPGIARTAGSAFLQGNHVQDRRDVQTGVKSVDIRPLKEQAQAHTQTPAESPADRND